MVKDILFLAIVSLAQVGYGQQHPPGVPPHQNQPAQGQGGHHHGKPLEFASEVHNREHVLEHLQRVVATKKKEEMTEEELEFHYFKLHDSDNNNKLDGLEISKALTHFHEDNTGTTEAKVFGDDEISNIVDSVIQENDENDDGYIEYFEFKRKQAQQRNSRQQQDGQPDNQQHKPT